jgi:hypothetical protein
MGYRVTLWTPADGLLNDGDLPAAARAIAAMPVTDPWSRFQVARLWRMIQIAGGVPGTNADAVTAASALDGVERGRAEAGIILIESLEAAADGQPWLDRMGEAARIFKGDPLIRRWNFRTALTRSDVLIAGCIGFLSWAIGGFLGSPGLHDLLAGR